MQMKVLERELRVALFDRSFRPPALTPIGRLVAAKAHAMLRAGDDLLDVCQSRDAMSGEFRMGFVPTSSVRLLPNFLSRVREQHPNAHFQVETGLSDDLTNKVFLGTLDAAVVTGTDDIPSTLALRTLVKEELVFCLPLSCSNWPLDECMKKTTFIHFMPHSGIGRLIAQRLSRSGWSPTNMIVLDSVEAVAECVTAGVGFSILPEPDIRRHFSDQMSLRSLSPRAMTRKLVLATIKEGRMRLYVERLAALLGSPGRGLATSKDEESRRMSKRIKIRPRRQRI
jgi:DNA-binding transcriptional LysR family regulator